MGAAAMQLTKREFAKGLILATGFASLYPAKGISADISEAEAGESLQVNGGF